jgi:D-alanine-D-alanine ligase
MASLRIGIVFDLLGSYPRGPGDPVDVDAEYEPEETIAALEGAIRQAGHDPVRIGNPEDLLASIGKGQLPALDVAWNIAEGRGGRNREAWAPVLLEMAGVPMLGSDALTLSLTLDKAWASALVGSAGVPVPEQLVLGSRLEAENTFLPGAFPWFVKPRWEGTAKGIRTTSRVDDRAGLAAEVDRIVTTYAQPAVVEAFLPGAEYTVTVVGHDPPRALPAVQRAIEAHSGIGVHAVAAEAPTGGWRSELPGDLSPELEAELAKWTLRSFAALDCRDFARADFRLDAAGRPRFLEMNPLPTFAPDGTFAILAELEGRSLEALLVEVLGMALQRLGLA